MVNCGGKRTACTPEYINCTGSDSIQLQFKHTQTRTWYSGTAIQLNNEFLTSSILNSIHCLTFNLKLSMSPRHQSTVAPTTRKSSITTSQTKRCDQKQLNNSFKTRSAWFVFTVVKGVWFVSLFFLCVSVCVWTRACWLFTYYKALLYFVLYSNYTDRE